MDRTILTERFIFIIFLTLVAVATCAYYGPFLHNFFIYDDFSLLEFAVRGPKTILFGYNLTLLPAGLLSNTPYGHSMITPLLLISLILRIFMLSLTKRHS